MRAWTEMAAPKPSGEASIALSRVVEYGYSFVS